MGGRGASSSGGGGGASTIRQYNKLGGGGGTINGTPGQYDSKLSLAPFQTKGDYTDNNNPELLKLQGQTDDKTANFLAKTWKERDFNSVQQQTGDQWSFYDNPMQATVLALDLNKPATVLSESDFNNYVQKTNSTVLYRGWSGQNAVDRFNNSPNSHIGNGINGDGYYFSASKSTAQGYGGTGMKAALSPNARVVSLNDLNWEMRKNSPRLKKSLAKAGSAGTRTFGPNNGQAQMALKMGYNTIDAGWAVIPLTRDAVVVSVQNAW
jgi:hypothetical protein